MTSNSSLRKKSEDNKTLPTDSAPDNQRAEKNYSTPFNLAGIDFLVDKYILNKDKKTEGETPSKSKLVLLPFTPDRNTTPQDNTKYRQLLSRTSMFNPDPVEPPLRRKGILPEMDYVDKNGRFDMDRVKTAVDKNLADAKAKREEKIRIETFIDSSLNDIRKNIPEDSNYFANEEGRDNSTTKDIVYDTEKMIKAYHSRQKDGSWKQFGKSFTDEITDSETYTFGAKELDNLGRINRILDKLEKEEKLTPSEQNLLNAAAARQAAEDHYTKDYNLAQSIGSVTAQAIPVVAEGLVVGGASQVAKTAVKSWMKKRLSKYMAKKLALGGVAGKIATHIPDAAGHVAGAVVETSLSPDTYKNAMDSQAGTTQYAMDNETQGIKYEGQTDRKGLGEAIAGSTGKAMAENLLSGVSEKATRGVIGKIPGAKKIKADKVLYDATDEIVTNALFSATNGNNPEFKMKDVLLPVIKSTLNVGGKRISNKIGGYANDKGVDAQLEKNFGKDEAKGIKQKIKNMTPAEIENYKSKIADDNNRDITHRQKVVLYTALEIDKMKKMDSISDEEREDGLKLLYKKMSLNDPKQMGPKHIQQIEATPKSIEVPANLPDTLPQESDSNDGDKDAPANEDLRRKKKEEKRRNKKRKKRSRNR